MSEKMRGTVEMTAAMIIIGTIGWFVVISGQSVLDVVFWRCVFGAAALFVICAGMGLLRGVLNLNTLGWAILGGVTIVTNWLMVFKAFSLSSISVSTVTYSTQPFILVVLGSIFFSERLTLNKFAWLAVAFGGLLSIIIAKPGLDSTGPDYVVGTNYVGGIALGRRPINMVEMAPETAMKCQENRDGRCCRIVRAVRRRRSKPFRRPEDVVHRPGYFVAKDLKMPAFPVLPRLVSRPITAHHSDHINGSAP